MVIGAAIGGIMNWAMNGAEFTWEGLGYFGVGAVAGAVGAGVGTGVSSALAGGSFGAGFIGSSAAMTATTSFTTGALIGGAAGFSGGFVNGFGNGLMGGQNFGEALWSGSKSGLIGGASGAFLGGIVGGFSALKDNRTFWTGDTKTTREFFVDRRGIHRSVAQFKEYERRVQDGTAPDWMKRSYYRWRKEINIQTIPNGKCGVDLSSWPTQEIYLGDYNIQGVNWETIGSVPYDATVAMRFGDYPSLVYNVDNFGLTQSSGFFSGVDRVLLSVSGIIDKSYCTPGVYSPSLFLRLIVSH